MKAVIRVQNCFSWLSTDSEKVRKTLYEGLRFRAKDYWHSRLYKQKIWNGYNEFFKRETGRFLTGLLPEVEFALKHLNCEYKILDERTKPKVIRNEIPADLLVERDPDRLKRKFILEDYQCEIALQAVQGLRCTIQAPTSAGKTAILMAMLECIQPGTPILIVTGKVNPVAQTYDELIKWGFKNIGRIYGKYNEPNIITCICVDSIHKMEKVLPYIKCLFVDEVHDKMMAKKAKWMYARLPNCGMRVCISATPFKFDGEDKTHKFSVKGFFGPIVKTKSDVAVDGIIKTKKLQERGRLSQSDCTFWEIKEPELPFLTYGDAVTQGIARNNSFHKIVAGLAAGFKGRTLIVVERLEHGDALNHMLPGSLWVQGKDDIDSRKLVIERLQNSTTDVIAIATNGIFNAAVNVFVHNLINAQGGQAAHLIQQLFGRGLRKVDDKLVLNYHDFLFRINEYLEKHSLKRIKIIEKEGHPLRIKQLSELP